MKRPEAISLQRDFYAAAVGIPGLPLQQFRNALSCNGKLPF